MTDDSTGFAGGTSGEQPEEIQRGNIWRLAIAQALAGANSVVLYATGAIVGAMLAPDPMLATLPISIFVVGMAACILPAGAIARRRGRRASFLAGTGAGVLTGLLGMLAVIIGSFWLFCFAAFLGGGYAAVVLTFRFAAADGVAPGRRARALSLVMAGGVAAGVVGPQLVNYTMDLWQPYVFAATFLAQAVVAVVSTFILLGVRLPLPTAAEVAGGRPLATDRAPAALRRGGHHRRGHLHADELSDDGRSAGDAYVRPFAGVGQLGDSMACHRHVRAEFLYRGFDQTLRCGARGNRGLAADGDFRRGGADGIDVAHFWATLILLGVGWNFGFLGASAMVLECHRPEEKTRVQSLNDFIVFGLMAVGSFSSGGCSARMGGIRCCGCPSCLWSWPWCHWRLP